MGGSITGLGKAIITGILTVAFPAKYGVWNNVSESGLVDLGVWPEFERGASFQEAKDDLYYQALSGEVIRPFSSPTRGE